MNLASKLDRETLHRKFFAACGEEFQRGASVHRLVELSTKRGVWEGAESDLARVGMQETIKGYIRKEKDTDGRRKYHSLPSLDSHGNEIQIYKDVAFLELGDYQVLFAKYEKRVMSHVNIYLDLVNQAKERYGYQHPLPLEVKSYVDAAAESAVLGEEKTAA